MDNRITNDDDQIARSRDASAPSASSGSSSSSSVRPRQNATHGLPDTSWLGSSLSDAPFRRARTTRPRPSSSSSSISGDLLYHRAHTAAPTNTGWGSTSFASSGMLGEGTAMLPEPLVFSGQPSSGLLGGNSAMNATQAFGGRRLSGSTPPIFRSFQPPDTRYGWNMANLHFRPCDPYFPMDIAKHKIPSNEIEAALRGMQEAFQRLSIQVDFENNPVGARLRTVENVELYLDLCEAVDGGLLMAIRLRRGDYLDANRYIHKIIDAAKGIDVEEPVHRSATDIQTVIEYERFLKRCLESLHQASSQPTEPPLPENHMGAVEDVVFSPIGSTGQAPILTLEGINYLALPVGAGSDLVISLQYLRRFTEAATRHQWLHHPNDNPDWPTTEARVRQIFHDLVCAICRAHRWFGVASLDFDPSKILVHLNRNASSLSAILVPVGYPTSGRFAAPETLVNQQQYNTIAANSWSLGVILLELLTGDSLYHHPSPLDPLYCFWIECAGIVHTETPLQIAGNIAANATNGIENNYRIRQFLRTVETVHDLSNEAKALLTSLLQKDPARRPSAQQILHHPWF